VDVLASNRSNEATLKQLQTKEAVAAAAAIKQFVDEIETQIKSVVRPIPVVAVDDVERRQEAYFGLLRLAPAISQVSYLDAIGNRVLKLSRVAINEGAGPADAHELKAWQEARPDQPYRSDVVFLDNAEPHVWLGIQERGAGGVTVATINLTFIRDVISGIQVGRQGLAYVVDRDGRLIAYPDVSPVLRQLNLGDLPQVAAALRTDPSGPTAISPVAGRSLDGREVVSYYQAVEPLGGWVFVEWPRNEANEPFWETALRTALLLALVLAVSVFAGLELTRKLVTDPLQVLKQGARRLNEKTLDQRIDLRTGDELEALADEFNRMAERLAASYTSLERKVQERTSELAHTLERETAVSGVLRLITRSPTSRESVLDAVAENAALLCDASGTSIWLRVGNTLRRAAGYGTFASEVGVERPISRDWITGRAAAEGRTVHEPDLASLGETEYPDSERRFQHGHRSALSTPIKHEGQVAGVISIGRLQAGGFNDRQIELLESAFADQVVIALELTRLFDEIQEKAHQLTITGERQEELIGRLRLWLSPELFKLILRGEEPSLKTQRAEITVVFCDLRGYTAFADRAQPERILEMLKEYHDVLGPLINKYGGTLERFTGDGVMVFFNAPEPCTSPEQKAVDMAIEMRDRLGELSAHWRRQRFQQLGFGVGIDQDFATAGPIGFKDRYDYAVIGAVTNCAARLCSEAGDGEVLISQAVYAAVADAVEVELKGDLNLKGFFEPVRAYNVLGLKEAPG
jgi:adenylate cyclase